MKNCVFISFHFVSFNLDFIAYCSIFVLCSPWFRISYINTKSRNNIDRKVFSFHLLHHLQRSSKRSFVLHWLISAPMCCEWERFVGAHLHDFYYIICHQSLCAKINGIGMIATVAIFSHVIANFMIIMNFPLSFAFHGISLRKRCA